MNVDIEYTTSIPHGGTLVDRRAPEDEREERKQKAESLRRVTLGPEDPLGPRDDLYRSSRRSRVSWCARTTRAS